MRWHTRRAVLIAGAVLGFAWGFASLHHEHRDHRRRFEQRVAAVCVDAALRAPRADRTE